MFKGVQFDYSGAKVLVTGGSNGIGLACARAYREAGASVSITGRKSSASEYQHDLSSFSYYQVDVSSREALLELATKLSALDVLVNNAGGTQADEWSHDGFDNSIAVNLSSAFHLSSACKKMLERSQFEGGASIVGIASMTSYFGSEWTPGYGPAKAGIVQMAKTLGHSWGKDGIRANAVAAGLTRSNLTSAVIDGMPEMLAENYARQGIERVGEGEDIAAAVLFLTSPAASWITGQTLNVDGGFTTGM